jgi:quercetin dioxygenase-like cupin family protein
LQDDGSGRMKALDKGNPRHPGFHKTDTIDYAIVLKGEIWALMDEGETLLRQGDVLVQRGTNHAWSNRTEEPAVLAFVLIDAKPV